MRYSKQRELVLHEVQQRCDHPTAEDIFSSLRKDYPALSLGTVYRNLNNLVDMQMVRRVSVPGQADRFDRTLAEHTHLYCRECGQVIDVPLQTDMLAQLLSDVGGAQIEQYSLCLYGLCPSCAKRHSS